MYHNKIYNVSTVNNVSHRLISSEELVSTLLEKALTEQRPSLQTGSRDLNCQMVWNIVLEEDDWRLLVTKLSGLWMKSDDITDVNLR